MNEITKLELLPPASEWQLMVEMAKYLQASGFLPEAIKTPAQAVTIMLKGRELGIPPMQAFSSINVIKGKPSLSAELMLAMVRERGHSIKLGENTEKRCVITGKRKDTGDEYTSVFTFDMAQKAGLTGQGSMYMKYPANMLLWRAGTNLCRVLFGDITLGMPATEEVMEYDEPVKQEDIPYNSLPPKKTYPMEVKILPEVVDRSTGEVIEAPVAPKPVQPDMAVKKPKKLTTEEINYRWQVAFRLGELNTDLVTLNKGGGFEPITLDAFNATVNKMTGCSTSMDAVKKYGIEGNLQDLVKARYKGEGLTWAQQMSAGLHILWEKEQEWVNHQNEVEAQGEEAAIKDTEEYLAKQAEEFGF